MENMMTNIQILSLNVNGLGCKIKRNTLFSFLDNLKSNIILLQETHSVKQDENKWQSEWKSKKIFFNHGNSQSKGVLIAINKNLDYELLDVISDKESRILMLKMEIEKEILSICNIYMPTQSNTEKQQDCISSIEKMIDVIGDCNSTSKYFPSFYFLA